MALYESEHTQFMRAFFAQHPEEKEAQLAGHLLLWNKPPISVEERAQLIQRTVKQNPYPYQAEET